MKNKLNKKDLPKYAGNYSGLKLWKKLAEVAKNLGRKTLWYVLLLYYTLESDEVSLGNKAIIMGALGYLILPLDLIPDVVPVLGLADDAAAIKLAYDTVKGSITPAIERKATHKLRLWFGEEPPTVDEMIDELNSRPGI
jgi:uncharacterized membrane protein YkvA (DUF1232 family)